MKQPNQIEVFREHPIAAKWGVSDFYDEHQEALASALQSRLAFTTGEYAVKKEIQWATITRAVDDGPITLTVKVAMDDPADLADTHIWSITQSIFADPDSPRFVSENERPGDGLEALQILGLSDHEAHAFIEELLVAWSPDAEVIKASLEQSKAKITPEDFVREFQKLGGWAGIAQHPQAQTAIKSMIPDTWSSSSASPACSQEISCELAESSSFEDVVQALDDLCDQAEKALEARSDALKALCRERIAALLGEA